MFIILFGKLGLVWLLNSTVRVCYQVAVTTSEVKPSRGDNSMGRKKHML